MIAFPCMLIGAAEEAGIKVPPENQIDDFEYDPEEFPHWHLFCNAQLGHAISYHGVHFENAKVIAKIPEADIKKLKWNKLIDLGFKM